MSHRVRNVAGSNRVEGPADTIAAMTHRPFGIDPDIRTAGGVHHLHRLLAEFMNG
jgi:hypothetical protein